MNETKYTTLAPGDSAFYEAFGVGAIPCTIIEVKGPSGQPNPQQRVTVKLNIRKPKGRFLPNDRVITDSYRVFPKETLHDGWKRSLNYKLLSGKFCDKSAA